MTCCKSFFFSEGIETRKLVEAVGVELGNHIEPIEVLDFYGRSSG